MSVLTWAMEEATAWVSPCPCWVTVAWALVAAEAKACATDWLFTSTWVLPQPLHCSTRNGKTRWIVVLACVHCRQ